MIDRCTKGLAAARPSTATWPSAPTRPSTAVLVAIAGAALVLFSTMPAQAEIATGPEVGAEPRRPGEAHGHQRYGERVTASPSGD